MNGGIDLPVCSVPGSLDSAIIRIKHQITCAHREGMLE